MRLPACGSTARCLGDRALNAQESFRIERAVGLGPQETVHSQCFDFGNRSYKHPINARPADVERLGSISPLAVSVTTEVELRENPALEKNLTKTSLASGEGSGRGVG